MSAEDVEVLIDQFFFLREGPPSPFREALLRNLRRTIEDLDALDRDHPVWSLLAVQTVNHVRLMSYTGWRVYHGQADEATDLAIVALDLLAGCRISTEAWKRLAGRSPAWRLEAPLLQGFFNFHLFSAGTFMNDLKAFLVETDQVSDALAYLRRPGTIEHPDFRWLTPNATAKDILYFAELVEAAA